MLSSPLLTLVIATLSNLLVDGMLGDSGSPMLLELDSLDLGKVGGPIATASDAAVEAAETEAASTATVVALGEASTIAPGALR